MLIANKSDNFPLYLAEWNVGLAVEHGGVIRTVNSLVVAGGELSEHLDVSF